MAKKIDAINSEILSNLFGLEGSKPKKTWTEKEIKDIFARKNPSKKTPEQRNLLIASAIFIQNGITPEDYNTLYQIAESDPLVNLLPVNLLFNGGEQSDDEFDDDEFDDEFDDGTMARGTRREGLTSFPIPDADKKSLVLKIQLRGVKKPPLWREVKIPANLNFEDLNDVIQTLFGWTDSHMWQFEKTPYGNGYRIARPVPDMRFDDGPTDIADQTPVTKVLKNVGDKMVYVYDFGDDWIHDISVKEVINEPSANPVCTAWKSDNPMEDIGGVWGLEEIRQMADPKVKHTKKEEKEFLDNHMFDDMSEFKEFMDEHKFDLNQVNDRLRSIPFSDQ